MRKAIALLLIIFLVFTFSVGCSNGEQEKYEEAVYLYEKGSLEEALKLFEELDDYEESSNYRFSCVQHLLAGIWSTVDVANGGSGMAVVLEEGPAEWFVGDMWQPDIAIYLIYEGSYLDTPINTGTWWFTGGDKIYVKYDDGDSANWDITIEEGSVTLFLGDDPLVKLQ
ncbi:MAG: hypothetical protein J6A42_02185 [Firmicutes bacterium]|nr:hypothetical protein [Bacillota bacterium]